MCAACRSRELALGDAYELLTDPVFTEDEPELPEGAWAKISASLTADPQFAEPDFEGPSSRSSSRAPFATTTW